MREERVHAGHRFDGHLLVNLIIKFAAFLGDGQHARARQSFKRAIRLGTNHAHTQVGEVRQIRAKKYAQDSDKYASEDLRAVHAAEYIQTRMSYCLISTGVPILCVEPKRL